MPTNIVDVDTFTSPIVAPASGDPRTAASVATAAQGLANRTRNLANRLGPIEFLLKGNVRLTFPCIHDPKATQWEIQDSIGNGGYLQVSNFAANRLFRLMLHGLTSQMQIESVSCYLNGGNAASNPHSALPADMPSFNLIKIGAEHQTVQAVSLTSGHVLDTSASVGAYDDWHNITYNLPTPYVIQANDFFGIEMRGETGLNSQTASLLVRGFSLRVKYHTLV